jgi:hypothetical protein
VPSGHKLGYLWDKSKLSQLTQRTSKSSNLVGNLQSATLGDPRRPSEISKPRLFPFRMRPWLHLFAASVAPLWDVRMDWESSALEQMASLAADPVKKRVVTDLDTKIYQNTSNNFTLVTCWFLPSNSSSAWSCAATYTRLQAVLG